MPKGKILKGIGGFYYVDCGNEVYECKARGSFRKQGITPLAGDNVEITVNEGEHENTIDKIEERKNFLVRPPLANLDRLFIVASLVDPKINTTIIDKLTAVAEYKKIDSVIVITKADLSDEFEKYAGIYLTAGFKTVVCDNKNRTRANEIKELLKGKVCAFAGNTGVGKSTLLNNIFPGLNLETGETSKKLGRGRHTTRRTELFKAGGGYIADTPGFSSMDFERSETITKESLPHCFREFAPYLDECKFNTNCSHINTRGCAVIEAVNGGYIPKSRYASYVTMYNEIKDKKQWQKK